MVITVLRTSDCPSQLEKKYKPAIDLVPDSDLDGFLWICTDLHLAWKISVPDQKSVPKRKDLPRPMSQEVEETLSLYMSAQIAVRISGKTNSKPFRSLSSFCTVSFLKSDYANTSPKNFNVANLMYRKLLFGSLWCVWFQSSPNCKLAQWLWYTLW